MTTQPNTSHLLNTVSSSHPSPNAPPVQHSSMLSVEQSLSLAKHTGEAPQINSLEDVLNLTGINEHPPAGAAKGLQPTSAPQTAKPPSSSTLSTLSNLSPSLLAAATGRSLGYNFALSGAANVLAYTSVHQNGQGPVSPVVSSLASPASASLHQPSPLLTSLGVGERGPRSSTIPPISVSTPNILKSHKAPVSSSAHLSSLAGKTGMPAVSSGISKAAGLLPMSWPGGNPQSVSSVMSPLVGNPPQSQVTSWKWSSSPYQGSLGGKRPSSSVGVEEVPANKKMVTTKGPENSAEVAALNIKQSLILELQRTQVTLKQLELVQRQYLLQRKVKEARDVEQKINLLLQRQRQVIHTIQTASWDGNLKKNSATVTESIGLGTSPLHTAPASSSIIKLGGVTPYMGAATSHVGVATSQLGVATSQVGGATSQVGGASFQSGHPIPPIPSLLASPPPTVGQTSHASTTSSLSSTSLASTVLPRSLPLLVQGHTAAPPTSTSAPSHSSPVVSSPSFVAVSSAFTYQPSSSLPSNQSLLATTAPKSSHSVLSAPSGQSSAATSPFTFTASTVGAHTSGLAPISAVTSVTQAPGSVPKVVGTSSSAHQPSPSQSDSDNVITAQETLVLLKNPALQEKLTMEKLQHLNSIRLQALNDYQRQRIQAFVAGLPPHEVPKDITELKKILQEKGFQIQVPVYLAAQAIPRLYAQELMRVSAVIGASAGSTSMATPSSSAHVEQHHHQQQGSTPSSSLLPIPSLLGQSATLSLSPVSKGAVGEKSEPLSTKGAHPTSLHHALSVTPPEAALAQQQQAQASHPWTDVQQRLKGIIAHMEQQQQSQTLSSLSGGSQGPQDWRTARTGYSLMENLSSNSSYMTRAQAKAKQLAELRAQQQRQRSLNTQEAYVTSHMKAIVRRDHELLGDRAGDERPFSSVEDAVKRLLPYHIYHEEDTPPEMEKKFDLLHRNICSLLVSRQNGILAKYHRLMLKEAEKEVSTGLEVCALREFVDGETPPTPTPPPDPPLLSTWPPLDPFNTTISGLQPSLQAPSSSWTPLSLANFTPTGKMF